MDKAPVRRRQAELILVARPPLFAVMIDLNCGRSALAHWQLATHLKPLPAALDESAQLRVAGWITRLEPEA